MSRLARKPIKVSSGVTVSNDGHWVLVKGPKGELKIKLLSFVKLEINGDEVQITKTSNAQQALANSGTMVALLKNAIEGVLNGFTKVLEIEGVGYKATMDGKTLVLSLGFVNPVKVQSPEGITIVVEKNQIKVSGIDRGLVGQVAAKIRSYKKPEPYKGKGIHYVGEVIVRKVGKKAGAAAS